MNKQLRRSLGLLLLLLFVVMSFAACQPSSEKVVNCKVTIECKQAFEEGFEQVAGYENGIMVPETSLQLSEGQTAYDALLQLAKDKNIAVVTEGTGATAYVTAVDGLKSGDCGEMSGWTYFVNDQAGDTGASQKVVQEGDSIVWSYVTSFDF